MFLVISVVCLRLKTLREKESYLLNPLYIDCNREKRLKPDKCFFCAANAGDLSTSSRF